MKVLIAAGGSGGHLFPAEILKKDLLKKGATVLIAGHGLKKSALFNKADLFKDIQAANPKNPIQFIWKTLRGVFQSIQLLFSFSPDVVVGFGSFHTFPVLLGSLFFRKKIILFEANTSLGKVNRFFSPFAYKIAALFPINEKTELVSLLPWGKKVVSKEEARKYYGIDENRFTILVFGGSQGTAFFNDIMPEVSSRIDAQVIHLTGIGKKTSYNACIKEFETKMDYAYAAADLVISRSGASTLTELIRHEKPSIVIPFPYSSEGQQEKNGRFVSRRVEGIRTLLQCDASAEKLVEEIQAIQKNIHQLKSSFSNVDQKKRPLLSEVIF